MRNGFYPHHAASVAALSARGIIVRALSDGEYYVNYRGGGEETASYEATAEDAIEAGYEMLESAPLFSLRLRLRAMLPVFDWK